MFNDEIKKYKFKKLTKVKKNAIKNGGWNKKNPF
jgi:hypothetical protein